MIHYGYLVPKERHGGQQVKRSLEVYEEPPHSDAVNMLKRVVVKR